ncbi:MAG: GNAT family N-acetyltransferase, partial [Spirochaetes bacterium]|nr:GNAT family N-acetyltransferase [Spirochaetota bacterium]
MNIENFKIRDAVLNDAEDVYKLIYLLEMDSQNINKKDLLEIYEQNLNDKNIFYKVAQIDDKTVGFISLHIQKFLHHCAEVAEVAELIVHPGYRGKNIGLMLIKEAEKIAQEKKCDTIELSSNMKRERAHNFYKRNGYFDSHFKF